VQIIWPAVCSAKKYPETTSSGVKGAAEGLGSAFGFKRKIFTNTATKMIIITIPIISFLDMFLDY
jgi:hypothetical protein